MKTNNPFVMQERRHQIDFHSSEYFSVEARLPGIVRFDDGGEAGPFPFVLPSQYSKENIFAGIREDALDYFAEAGIKWHMGVGDGPSNHMLDSQVCAVNFLFALQRQPATLLKAVTEIYNDAVEMVPITNNSYVEFEWIGTANYLNEWRKHEKPTRGEMVTSCDALFAFRNLSGQLHLVLVEWKYTEQYPTEEQILSDKKSLIFEGRKGKVRRGRYDMLFKNPTGAVIADELNIEAFSCEPAYQLLRQQLLAYEMERARELDADLVSVLHLSPAANHDLHMVTPVALRSSTGEDDIFQTWSNLVRSPDRTPRFKSITIGDFFSTILAAPGESLIEWSKYISKRYAGTLNASNSIAGG